VFLYRLIITLVSLYLIVLLIIPNTLVALFKAYMHCLEHFISSDIQTPRSFSQLTLVNSLNNCADHINIVIDYQK